VKRKGGLIYGGVKKCKMEGGYNRREGKGGGGILAGHLKDEVLTEVEGGQRVVGGNFGFT